MIHRLRPRTAAYSAGLLFILLLTPPLRHALEASMSAQMLVQIPLLVVVGLFLARAVPAGISDVMAGWNLGGVNGAILATLTSAFWMLPRELDAAVTEPLVASAKFLSVPLLIGLPLALSWGYMGFIVKGVFLLEAIATLFRLGWLYLITPERLCNLYLIDDQQRLGRYLLVIGAALFLWIGWKLVWGRLDSQR